MYVQTEHGPGENVVRLKRDGGFEESFGRHKLVLHCANDSVQQ